MSGPPSEPSVVATESFRRRPDVPRHPFSRSVGRSSRPAWLHLDLEVLDEAALPAVTYPQPRGLDWDAFVALASALR
jgi:hypothetical protein